MAAAQQWREAVKSLMQPNTSSVNNNNIYNLAHAPMKVTLPESFRLMIQIEEVVDVSKNAETRLGSAGNNKENNNQSGGNRTLKMCLSDGYYNDGSNVNTVLPLPQPPQTILQAMEIAPIPNLMAHARAGLKIVLHGPIDIRWGVLLLHEGNALVLGGEVQELVELQTKALEEAKRRAGIGVDPTIKALVWNPEEMGEDEDGTFLLLCNGFMEDDAQKPKEMSMMDFLILIFGLYHSLLFFVQMKMKGNREARMYNHETHAGDRKHRIPCRFQILLSFPIGNPRLSNVPFHCQLQCRKIIMLWDNSVQYLL